MALVLALGAALRFAALGGEGLWCDEGYTAFAVGEPVPELVSRPLTVDDAPPLYYLVEKAAVAIGGRSEAGLRFVSALAGVLAVAVLVWPLLRPARVQFPESRVAFRAADLWSAAVLALLTTGIFHARQARSYSLLLLFATCFVLAARSLLVRSGVDADDSPRSSMSTEAKGPTAADLRNGQWSVRGASVAFAVFGVLLCLTHNVGILLVLVSLILWPLGTRDRVTLPAWFLLHLPALVVWGSWILLGSQLDVHNELNLWTQHYWESHRFSMAPLYSVGLFLPGGLPATDLAVGFAVPANLSRFWGGLSILSGIVCLAAGVGVGRRGHREREGLGRTAQGGSEAAMFRVEFGFLVLPLALLTLVSLAVAPVYVLGRTDVLAYPAFVLLMGRGLSRLPKWWSLGILVFWGGLSFLSLAPSYGVQGVGYAKGADRTLAEQLGPELGGTDWVVHTFMTSPSIEYYLERDGVRHETAWFPLSAGQNTASDYPTPADSLESYVAQARRLRDEIEAALPESGDVWIFGLIAPGAEGSATQVGESRVIDVGQLGYPVSVFLYQLVGTKPVPVAFMYRQDWVAGDRVVLRVPKRIWTPLSELPPVRFEVRS
ncbi:MAG: hypothetical protein R3E97_03030 [Candidatus Eisenbacteria bacterium]